MIAEAERKYGIVPPYQPVKSEIEGLKRIAMGTRIVLEQIRQDFIDDESFWDGVYGMELVFTGVYQLAVPILAAVGTMTVFGLCKYGSY